MFNVSTTGASVVIKSTISCPTPYPITNFADDGSPFQIDDNEVTGEGMGLNNDLVVHTMPKAIHAKITVIANSPDDILLNSIFQMNHAANAAAAFDVLDMTVIIPNIAKPFRYVNGKIQSGPEGPSSSADGKNQSRTYGFVFERAQF